MVVRHQIAQAPEPLGDDVEYRRVSNDGHVLIEPRHADLRLSRHGPGIRRLFATHHTQERRLPRAVTADDRHTFAPIDPKGGVLEQRLVAEGERNVVERDERHVSAYRQSAMRDQARTNQRYTHHPAWTRFSKQPPASEGTASCFTARRFTPCSPAETRVGDTS